MIIPIKCFTCGNVLADKYRYYLENVRRIKLENNEENNDEENEIDNIVYLTNENVKKRPEGKVLDDLQLTRMCCRRHMLTHVDIN